MVADFTWSCRAFSGVFRLWGSCRGLAVLGSCSSEVQHPLGAGEAIWVTENTRGSSLGQPNSEGLSENVGKSFHGLARLVVAFLGCGVSCQDLAVLCHCSTEVWLLLRPGVASCAVVNPRGFSPGQADSTGKDCLRIRQIFSWPGGCRPFLRGWCLLVLLCGAVAPPKGNQSCVGTAPVVVGFRQLLRPALLDGRQAQVQ